MKRIPMKMRRSILTADRHTGLLALILTLLLAGPSPSSAQVDKDNLELTITVKQNQWMPGEVFVMRAVLKNNGPRTLAVDMSGDLGTSYYLENAGSKVYPCKMWANYGVPCEDEEPRLKTFSTNDFVLIGPGESYTKKLHCRVSAERLKSIKSITYKENHVKYFTSWVTSDQFVKQAEKAFPDAEVFRITKTLTSNALSIRVGK